MVYFDAEESTEIFTFLFKKESLNKLFLCAVCNDQSNPSEEKCGRQLSCFVTLVVSFHFL